MRFHLLISATSLSVCATHANAFQFLARFVERVGNTDVVIPQRTLNAHDGNPRRIRVQFGVFDDANGPAPAGGFLGWNVGAISVSGAPDNSADRRTNGRIAPFTFASGASANGAPLPVALPEPIGSDFQGLTAIDASLGTQSPFWGLDGNGDPLPMPPPRIWGRNTFVSLYEITTDPGENPTDYTITIAGNVLAATDWRIIGTPIPPDPDSGEPGSVTYAPFPLSPQPITATLQVVVPAPGAGILTLMLIPRRRRTRRHASA